MKQKEESRKTK